MFKNKKNIILICTIVFLSFTYILSFITKNNVSKKKIIKTELINEKYQNDIVMFQIKIGNKLITLSKNDDLWFVQTDTSHKEAIPADTNRISRFISDLTQLRQIYKVSDKINKNNDFSFDTDSAITIRYYLEDSTFSDLIFGGKDFTNTYRYLMTGKSLAVFQVDSSFETYLSVNTQAWCDPNIISQSVLGVVSEQDIQTLTINSDGKNYIKTPVNDSDFYTKMNKLLNLRHGGLADFDFAFNPEFSTKIEFGNKKWVTIQIAPSENDEDYIVKSDYYIENSNKKYTFYSKISLWTYNNIKENTL